MPYRAWRKITDGTEQKDRPQPPLQDGFFLPDERSFVDLLALGAKFAATVDFYDLQNRKHGSWQELFLRDESVVMALILSTDTERLERRFLELARGGELLSQARLSYEIARSIDTWYRRLERCDSILSRGLSWHIFSAVEKGLAAELHSLALFIRGLPPKESWLDFASFDRIWGVQGDSGAESFPLAREEQWRGRDERERFLADGFRSFLNAMSYLRKKTELFFPESLHTGRHDPAIGLFLAFLGLFRKAQESVNSFSERHLAFYYHQVLRFAPRGGSMESCYLVLQPDGNVPELVVPKGTRFSAGKGGDGAELLYCADAETVVTDAQVRQLCTLHFERDPLISPEHELGFVTGAYSTRIPLPDPAAKVAPRPWPLFGAAKTRGQQFGREEARLGFAVASPVLLLAEGRREVSIALKLTPPPYLAPQQFDSGEEFCASFGRLFSRYLLEAGEPEQLRQQGEALLAKAPATLAPHTLESMKRLLHGDRQDLFFSHFSRIFTVSLSGAAGWFEVPNPVITRGAGGCGLKVGFSLGPEAPAVVASNPLLHGDCSSAGLAVARFLVNPRGECYPYSLFTGFALAQLSISVAVQGVSDLLLHNNHGQLDPARPFNPFGPLPVCNSFLVLGNREMAAKRVQSLGINLEWGELPGCGFPGYYRGYGAELENADFVVDAAVLREGEWQEAGEQRERGAIPLFQSSAAGCLLSTRRITLKGNDLFKSGGKIGTGEFRYGVRCRSGFVRLTLAGPEMAFGHRDYSSLVTETLTANARIKRRQRLRPLPNPPYTPLVTSISVDYSASAVIKASSAGQGELLASGERIIQLHPFGTETVFPSRRKRLPLLPEPLERGNLCIALSSSRRGGSVTLFFHLKQDSTRLPGGIPPRPRWSYLAGNSWHPLDQSHVLSDSTEGFLSSGIVTLRLPEEADTEHDVLPTGYYWLRLSADGELSSFCSLYSVQSQALRVTRLAEGGGGENPGRLPPGSIKAPLVSIPGVEKVSQPEESFGGEERESPEQLVVRGSERLRHKQRAVLPWDYERLVLSNFPELLKVKCFPNLASACSGAPAPGHLMLVVVPRLKQGERELNLSPRVNAAELERIRLFVRSLASPFAEIEVRNPAYEWIRVVCAVKLKNRAELQRGLYLNRLNQAVVDFLSPWQESGTRARFGWQVRKADIESFILEQGYVELVTGFSMLHIVSEQPECYLLYDTARGESLDERPAQAVDYLRPRFPWSLAVPTANHSIRAIDDLKPRPPEPTGLDQLQIGETFIMGA